MEEVFSAELDIFITVHEKYVSFVNNEEVFSAELDRFSTVHEKYVFLL